MTVNAADPLDRGCVFDQLVPKALVIALAMVMLDEFRDHPSQMTFSERDYAVEALVFDRAYESLGVRIRVRRLKRRLHDPNSGLAQPRARARSTLRPDHRSARDGRPGHRRQRR
jgi:hypothetical protein